jgi:integrase
LDKVDLRNRFFRLEPGDTKTRTARNVPVCDSLFEILSTETRILRKAGESRNVFLYKGQPVTDIRKALKLASKKAGIPYGRSEPGGYTFHDLRHSFVTHARKSGIPESVIMKISGHETNAMFLRYNKVDEEDTRKAVDQMDAFLSTVDQTVDQDEEFGNIETTKPAMEAGFEG